MEYIEMFRPIVHLDKWIIAYLVFKIIDFITGFAKAGLIEGFKSSKLKNGVLYFILDLTSIVFAGILDILFGLDVILISTKMILVYKEAVSIVENWGQLNLPLPKILKDKIQDLNPDKDKE